MNRLSHKYFECDCQSPNHVVRFTWFQDDWMAEHPQHGERELFIETRFNPYQPWYKRVCLAFRYIFNMTRLEGEFECCTMSDIEIQKMKDFLNQFDTERVNDEN